MQSNLVLDTGRRHAAADRAVLPADRGRLGTNRPVERWILGRTVPSGTEPAQRHSESDLRGRRAHESPGFTFDNRLVDQGEAWLTSLRTNLTWIKNSHSLKAGFYLEQSRNSEGNGGVGAGPWAGQFNFTVDASNPVDTNNTYANALLGTFRDYTEIDAFSEVKGKRLLSEFYLQDTWRATQRLTFDYGVRFLWYQPWYSTQPLGCLRRGALRSRARASALPAGADQQRERGVRSGDRSDAPERLRRSRSCRTPAIATTEW